MLLIAIDDTDNAEPGCIGTGKLARMLARELCEHALVEDTSVTRHQLLVHPDIPFTSHNSAACIQAEAGRAPLSEVARRARDFVLAHPNAGANPGLCVMEPSAVPSALLDFARRAQREVLTLAEADRMAAERARLRPASPRPPASPRRRASSARASGWASGSAAP
jgi:tRNA(Ile2) C34 agmatinyltransferase TiaS